MEPAKSAESLLSRDELEKALADQSVEQLQEMAKRLTKSMDNMREMLADLEAEKPLLKTEAADLEKTIELMMQEMQKLNIGAGNTVEPQLEEGPLDFVGRFWEKVKARDTAFQTSEHVGEITKPKGEPVATANVQQVAMEASAQVAQKLQGALGPWWQRAQGFVSEKQSELVGAVAARAKQPARGSDEARRTDSGKRSDDGKRAERRSKRQGAGGYPDGEAASKDTPAEASSSTTSASQAASSESKAVPLEVAAPAASSAKDAPQAEEQGKSDRMAGAEDKIASTVLIEAKLTVDEGAVHTLEVRAADRCKEVAQRFVQEHSLKAWFVDPLTKWLKQVESDAVKFPVIIEADLADIRKQYSRK